MNIFTGEDKISLEIHSIDSIQIIIEMSLCMYVWINILNHPWGKQYQKGKENTFI